jgi:hypothetical protein
MLIFYPLEFVSFFSAPFAPVLAPRWITPKQGGQAALWSIRAWLVYVLAQVGLLIRERNAIRKQEQAEIEVKVAGSKGELEMATPEEKAIRVSKERTARRKAQVAYQLVANVSRLPVIIHWCVSFMPVFKIDSAEQDLIVFSSHVFSCVIRSVEGGIYPYEV